MIEIVNDSSVETYLTQWQTCVEMANSTSQRRDAMNNIFVTVNLALMATVSFVFDLKSIFILIAGIVLCILWIAFIRNFKLLNKAKFEVIQELEEHLPASPFRDEWKKLAMMKKYMEGTKLEKVLPWLFIVLYGIAIIVIVFIEVSN